MRRERTRPARQSLVQMLGLTFGLAVTIGNTIGAGILRTPGDIAGLLPTAAGFIGIWVVGGLYALLGANALAELGTMMPRSGAQYVLPSARHLRRLHRLRRGLDGLDLDLRVDRRHLDRDR